MYFSEHSITRDHYGRSQAYHTYGKRALDVTLVLAFLPIWLPLVGVLWVLAWLESGTGFYVDLRVARSGRLFRCVKIRTMHPNTPRRCAAYKPLYDPRITWLGMFLRRASLDEVPQLWCVLKGEMSLVGPRPMPVLELRRYGAQRAAYLQVRPGLTGLWQVSGRNALNYKTRIALDVSYSQNMSFWMDFRILGATVVELIRLNGR